MKGEQQSCESAIGHHGASRGMKRHPEAWGARPGPPRAHHGASGRVQASYLFTVSRCAKAVKKESDARAEVPRTRWSRSESAVALAFFL